MSLSLSLSLFCSLRRVFFVVLLQCAFVVFLWLGDVENARAEQGASFGCCSIHHHSSMCWVGGEEKCSRVEWGCSALPRCRPGEVCSSPVQSAGTWVSLDPTLGLRDAEVERWRGGEGVVLVFQEPEVEDLNSCGTNTVPAQHRYLGYRVSVKYFPMTPIFLS
ncbi:uncharacterized protein LY89DRAFT_687606 [Mollisia scopiformis]|uniref:Uncharacterized protein n=1 Tax=Mollisia scopiformis TaxID=149040 RepID=A0A194X026_MOLSC|nr:uncharacterized protein LY89DRAFT_687606 [Mollisia scopiformis]KUJ13553.1 hypothetical protein LY89DRAFT_687606 [Mollisia scopiformis]